MRIKIVNPNTTQSMTDKIYAAAELVARPDTQIVAVSPANGPASIDNFHDQFATMTGLLEEIHKGVKENFDGFIVAAACDPGLYAARQIANVPVVGIGEASMYMASIVAASFSVVTVIDTIKPLLQEVVDRSGMRDRCVSIRSTSMNILDYERDPERGLVELTEESRKAVLEDGAEAICLGSAGMVKFAADLEAKLEVPVFDGVTVAVKLVESLVDLGKTTSKIMTFKYPGKKEYRGFPSIQP
jgi:allantoin racemase